MRNISTRETLGRAGLALAVILVPAALLAQTPASQAPAGTMGTGTGHPGMMTAQGQGNVWPGCAAYMQRRQAVQQQFQTMDSKLDTLLGQMNAAKGTAKVDAMAALINELVSQRNTFRSMMIQMEPMMMGRMMENMAMGMMGGGMGRMRGWGTAPQGQTQQSPGQESQPSQQQLHHP
jgi:hypothetical protein